MAAANAEAELMPMTNPRATLCDGRLLPVTCGNRRSNIASCCRHDFAPLPSATDRNNARPDVAVDSVNPWVGSEIVKVGMVVLSMGLSRSDNYSS